MFSRDSLCGTGFRPGGSEGRGLGFKQGGSGTFLKLLFEFQKFSGSVGILREKVWSLEEQTGCRYKAFRSYQCVIAEGHSH
jgi:hypothetical protein